MPSITIIILLMHNFTNCICYFICSYLWLNLIMLTWLDEQYKVLPLLVLLVLLVLRHSSTLLKLSTTQNKKFMPYLLYASIHPTYYLANCIENAGMPCENAMNRNTPSYHQQQRTSFQWGSSSANKMSSPFIYTVIRLFCTD